MRLAKSVAMAALLVSSPAGALEIYCDAGNLRLHDGGQFETWWKVTHPGARRVQLPGRTKPTTTCTYSWRSVSAMYRPIEIVAHPRIGRAEVRNTYRVVYFPQAVGSDELTIKVFWNRHGHLSEATVRYKIEVVGRPL